MFPGCLLTQGLLIFVKVPYFRYGHTLFMVFVSAAMRSVAASCSGIFVSLLGLGVRVMRTLFFRLRVLRHPRYPLPETPQTLSSVPALQYNFDLRQRGVAGTAGFP